MVDGTDRLKATDCNNGEYWWGRHSQTKYRDNPIGSFRVTDTVHLVVVVVLPQEQTSHRYRAAIGQIVTGRNKIETVRQCWDTEMKEKVDTSECKLLCYAILNDGGRRMWDEKEEQSCTFVYLFHSFDWQLDLIWLVLTRLTVDKWNCMLNIYVCDSICLNTVESTIARR